MIVRQLNGREPLLVGQTATFECTSHGSRPQANIYWLFQGVRHDAPMNGKCRSGSLCVCVCLQITT